LKILTGDIGGTYTRLAVFDTQSGQLQPSSLTLFRSINSSSFGGRLLASYVYEDAVTTFFEDVTTSSWGNDIFQTGIPKSMIGKTVKEAFIKFKEEYNILLIALKNKGGMLTNPPLDVVVEEGDEVLLLCSVEEMEKISMS